MKVQFAARVIGHELIEGEKPKTDAEGVKVKLAIRHVQELPGKSSVGTLLRDLGVLPGKRGRKPRAGARAETAN
jgi:hypothetical protein